MSHEYDAVLKGNSILACNSTDICKDTEVLMSGYEAQTRPYVDYSFSIKKKINRSKIKSDQVQKKASGLSRIET